MDLATVAILGGLFLAYAMVSGRLEGTVLTAPLVFVAFGFLAGPGGAGLATIDVEHSVSARIRLRSCAGSGAGSKQRRKSDV